jgi:uncharacterized protein
MPFQPDSTPSDRHWQPGGQVLLRYRRLGPVSYALPVTVVGDELGQITLSLRPGTPIKRRVMPDGAPIPRDLPYAERARLPHVGDGTWTDNHALILIQPGDAFDIRLFWHEDWTFRGWYVNLQDPVRRVPTGFDTADHILAVAVAQDRSWRWKDEHELADAVRIGRFTPGEAAAIQATGEQVIPRIEAGAWPFDDSLTGWRPDPAWPIPNLPPNWNDD